MGLLRCPFISHQHTCQMLKERMKKLRKAHGYTQEMMAERMHMDQATYSSIESGRRQPTAEELERFCTIVGISLDAFMNGDILHGPINGTAVNGTKPHEDAGYNATLLLDMLDRKDRQLEGSQGLMRSMLEVLRSTLDQMRKQPGGG